MFYGVIYESTSDRLQLSDFKLVNLTKAYIDKYNIKGIQPNDSKHKSVGWEYEEGKLVGFVDVYYDPKNPDYGERRCINNLEVDKKYRRKGLGTQILDYAVKSMKGDFIIVEASNKVAFNMYKKYGFKVGSDTEKKNGKVKYYQMYLKFPECIEPINEASRDKYYRITYEGIGIYEAFKKYSSKEEWNDFLNSKAAKWLPNPIKLSKVTSKSFKCYFTQFGYNKFKSSTLRVFENVLDKDKIITDIIDIDENKIKYRDKYQIVI